MMQEIFIEVNKIVTKHKKDDQGKDIIDPISKKSIPDGLQIHSESIRIDEIRSFRTWRKTSEHETYIDGDMTKIYLRGNDDSKKKKPEMLVAESYDSFAQRLKTIRANVEAEA